MWKKFPLYSSRNRDPIIGNPVLLETTMDEQILYSYKDAAEVHLERSTPDHSPVDTTTAYPVKQSMDKPRGLRKPVNGRMPLTSRNERPVSDIPTVSSRYSQPSPDVRQQGFRRSAAPAASPSIYTDVSPPSSPEISVGYNPHEWQGSPDISPVEEMPETPGLQLPPATFRSNIPVPQRSNPTYQASYLRPINSLSDHYEATGDRISAATRWDDFVQSEATPRSTLIKSDPDRSASSIPRKPHASSGDQGTRPSFAQRAMQGGITGLGLNTPARPVLAGSTGQRAVASTVPEKPHPPLKKVPGREIITSWQESHGTTSPSEVDSGLSTPTGPVVAETSANQPRFDAERYSADIKPIVPLKAGNNTPPKNPSTPTAATMPSNALSTATNQWYAAAAKSPPFDPTGYDEVHRLEAFTILTGTREQGSNEKGNRSDQYAVQPAAEEHPSSRFSFTTYATGTTHGSRPSSPVESFTGPTVTPQSPVIGRKRPITSGTSNAKATARKPTPSQLSPISISNESEQRNSKELPQLPRELQSEDLIVNLQVQVDNLHARRANLQRVIRDFTRSSSLSKDRLESMKTELADLQRREHETGLRLHRAYRRRDRQEYREPTAMWVRRITG